MRYIHNDKEYTQKGKNVVQKFWMCRPAQMEGSKVDGIQSEAGLEKRWIMESICHG